MRNKNPFFTPWDEPTTSTALVIWKKSPKQRWRKYFLLLLLAYIGIASGLMLYWNTPKGYTSHFSLMLPGTGNSSKVSLERVGEAQSASTSPYAIQNVNPSVNYKQILLSNSVLVKTAHKLNLDESVFQKPKVKLVDRSSIIQISVKGISSVDSNRRAWALYQSFTDQLTALRQDEQQKRAQSVKKSLFVYTQTLNDDKQRLVAFKKKTALISHKQYDDWTSSAEQLRQQIELLKADQTNIQGYIDQLSSSLSINPDRAADAFTLQADELFQLYQAQYHLSESQLANHVSKWGNNHPAVINEKEKRRVAQEHLLKRSLELVGLDNLSTLKLINLGKSRLKSGMFEKLILSFAESKGLNNKIVSLTATQKELVSKISLFSDHVAKLDDLERELNLSEAIYTSAAAQLDLNQVDIYGSYPLVQVLAKPSYPKAPSSPNKIISLLGAIMAAILSTFSLTLLWYRKKLLHKVLANL
ncbi:MAG: hypothetical protein COB04_05770 [Gammaproteobacteria bacterium]|nr:MAG: hypothetical protein COB04_17870 [Gammaproteobacteria bacterium]PCJ19401.1 MAG: hypothetical protein COB04_05770 [Gammaproteobacteria bacterium]